MSSLKMAYADPPYFGCCKLYDHCHSPEEAGVCVAPEIRVDGCWDDPSTYARLLEVLATEFPDGWALSATSTSLRVLLPLCPEDVRVAAWVKPFCAFKRGVRPCYAWEPVIFRGGRNPSNGFKHPPPVKGGKQTTPKDFLAESITLKKGLTGAKPERFCQWVLDLLGFQSGDVLVDLFLGTEPMTREVERGVLK